MNLPTPRDLVADDHNLPHPTLNTKFSASPMADDTMVSRVVLVFGEV
jgi:hypothetical protein